MTGWFLLKALLSNLNFTLHLQGDEKDKVPGANHLRARSLFPLLGIDWLRGEGVSFRVKDMADFYPHLKRSSQR